MKKVLGIIVVILLCLISFFLYKEYFDNKDIITSVFKAQDNKDKILYNNCLNSSYKYDGIDDDFNESEYINYDIGGHLIHTSFWSKNDTDGLREWHIEEVSKIFNK